MNPVDFKIDRDRTLNNIFSRQEELEISNHELSKRSDLDITTIYNLRAGRRTLGLDVLFSLCKALALSMDNTIVEVEK